MTRSFSAERAVNQGRGLQAIEEKLSVSNWELAIVLAPGHLNGVAQPEWPLSLAFIVSCFHQVVA